MKLGRPQVLLVRLGTGRGEFPVPRSQNDEYQRLVRAEIRVPLRVEDGLLPQLGDGASWDWSLPLRSSRYWSWAGPSGLTRSGFGAPPSYCHGVASEVGRPRSAYRFSALQGSGQYASIGRLSPNRTLRWGIIY